MGTKNEKKTIEKRNKKVAQIIRRLLIYLSDEILLAGFLLHFRLAPNKIFLINEWHCGSAQ